MCELNKLQSLTSLRIQNNPMLKGMRVNDYTLQIIARIANLTVNLYTVVLLHLTNTETFVIVL